MSKITATLYLDEKYRDFSMLVRSQKKQVSKVIDGFIDDYIKQHQEELNALKLKNDIMTEIKLILRHQSSIYILFPLYDKRESKNK